MLLTGSQISTALSSGIVCIFTSILFFSGYALQQKTVRDFRYAIQVQNTPAPEVVGDEDVYIPDRKQQILSYHDNAPRFNWKRVAYARAVRDFGDVCEALMFFAELTHQKSPAQKVLLYPAAWDDWAAHVHHDHSSQAAALATGMRLLSKAHDHDVALIPIHDAYGAKGRSGAAEELLGNLLALTSFERVLYLPPRGLVLDAALLDSLFRAPINASVTALEGLPGAPDSAWLVRPSLALSKRPEVALARIAGPILKAPELASVILPTSFLRHVPEGLDLTLESETFYQATGYLRFSDMDIAGPEFDLEKGTFASLQPDNLDLRPIWRNSYDRFRLMRMNYCGLDLQPLAKVEDTED